MKYIRLENGICEVDNENLNYVGEYYKKATWNKSQLVYAEANTIEELCDAFIIRFYNKNTHLFEYAQEKKISDLKKYSWASDDVYEIYGAIWTNKGFIFVAKLNEKGELELL